MKRALILMAPHVGHYNSSYHLALSLQNVGYEVTYAGQNGFESTIRSLGFNFKPFLFLESFNDHTRFDLRLFIRTVFQYLPGLVHSERFKKFKAVVFLSDQLIDDCNPDLIFIDSLLYIYPLVLFKYKEKIVLLETMLSRIKEPDIGPLNCHTKRFHNLNFQRFFVKIQWLSHSIKLKRLNLLRRIAYCNQSNYQLAERYLATQGITMRHILDKHRCFFYNAKFLKEIVLSPKEIDLPRRLNHRFQLHFSAVRKTLQTEDHDTDYPDVLSLIKYSKSDNKKKIIYCSLGSIASLHYEGQATFFQKVITALEGKVNRILVMSTGSSKLKTQLQIKSENIFVLSKIPQHEFLNYCDVFITHGGLNSIIEAILTTTPLIVFPLNRRWDHVGNASRVIFHKIGFEGNIHDDKSSKIAQYVENIIDDQHIVKRMENLKICFTEQTSMEANLEHFLHAK